MIIMTKKVIAILAVFLSIVLTVNSQGDENALNFDGVDDYITLNTLAGPLSATDDFTVEFWMKADSGNNTATVRVNFFAINPAVPGENKFSIIMGAEGSYQTGQLSIYEAQGSPSYLTSTATIGDDACHHVAYVRTGNMSEAFLDGVSIGTLPVASPILTDDRISLGQEWDNVFPSDFYNGEMEELRIWNVARSQTEIQENMHTKLTGSETGLVGYYNFDQGTAGGNNSEITTLTDLTMNGHDGTLVNFALDGPVSNWISSSCYGGLGIEDDLPAIRTSAHPNPCKSASNIRFQTERKGHVELSVYDMTGQRVTILVNESLPPGDHQAHWNAERLPSGVYFYQVTANGKTVTGKIVLVND